MAPAAPWSPSTFDESLNAKYQTLMTARLHHLLFTLLVALLLALAVLGVLRQANPLLNFPSLDNGYYLYFGQQILAGKTIYIDMWESKPPAIFYVDALGLWLARGSRWGVWLLEFSTLFSAGLLCFFTLRPIYGRFPALLATLAWLWALEPILQGGNLTEEFSLPFNFLALLAFWLSLQKPAAQWPNFVIGLTFAASFIFRPNNTGVQMALVLAWLIAAIAQKEYKTLFHRLFWSGLGALLSLGLVSFYFLAQGNFAHLVNAAFFYNLAITQTRSAFLPTLLNGLNRIGIPSGFALLGYGIMLSRVGEKRRAETWEVFLLLLWPLEVILSGLSGRGYDHYLIPWMVALAPLTAILIESALPVFSRFFERKALPAAACLLLIGIFLSQAGLTEYQQALQRLLFERQAGIEMDHPVAAYLRQHTQPEDTVLVWGARLAFNFLSRRPAPTAYVFYPLLLDVPFSAQMSAQFYADLTAKKPILIVDAARVNQDLVPALDPILRKEQFKSGQLWPTLPKNIASVLSYIDENYRLVETIDRYPIYRLK